MTLLCLIPLSVGTLSVAGITAGITLIDCSLAYVTLILATTGVKRRYGYSRKKGQRQQDCK